MALHDRGDLSFLFAVTVPPELLEFLSLPAFFLDGDIEPSAELQVCEDEDGFQESLHMLMVLPHR